MAQKSLLKRVVSSFTALAIATVAMPVIPAFAEAGTVSYSFDGYDVEYSVKNEWIDGQSIEVKITNTGDEPILNWAFKYNAEGVIDGLWNASVYDTKETSYVIKNVGWNYEIAPDASVSFGYTLSDYSGTNPDKFELCAKRVDKTEGYDVQYNITNEWDTGLQGEIVITNTSEEPLEAWKLSFDTTFTINNLWDGRIISSEENHYVVASEIWSNPIDVGGSKTIGFTGSKQADDDAALCNFSLSVIAIDDDGNSGGTGGNTGNDDPNPNPDIDVTTDTDSDKIPDAYEEIFGTDKNKPDTDDDGLTDYEEIALIGTDPLVYDSVTEGTSDADADCDGDGLTNKEELTLGTSPTDVDTDFDGLTDYDEIYVYNTDPLNPDTDGDGINDGDEIKLGLDPNSDTTDGVKDTERVTHQVIGSDSDIFSYMNDEDNPLKISIEIDAAGLAENCLTVDKSRYYHAIENSAVVGVIPEFEYAGGLKVDNMTIKFEVDETARANKIGFYAKECAELEGIKRLNVFEYFDDIGVLLPIETHHDVENNVVYAETSEMGTYCVLDMEIWFKNLGIDPISSDDSIEVLHIDLAYNSAASLSDENSINSDNSTTREKVDLALCLDTRTCVSGSEFSEMKQAIKDIVNLCYDNKLNVGNIYVYYQNKNSYQKIQITNTNLSVLDSITRTVDAYYIANNQKVYYFDQTAMLEYAYNNIGSRETVLFFISNKDDIVCSTRLADKVKTTVNANADRVHIVMIGKNMYVGRGYYADDIVKATNGLVRKALDEYTVGDVLQTYLEPMSYKILLANKFEEVELKGMLRKASGIDSDDDKLSDWGEINFDVVNLFDNNPSRTYCFNSQFPTIQDYIDYITTKTPKKGTKLRKASKSNNAGGFDRFNDYKLSQFALNTPIIVAHTLPHTEDSDFDGIIDSCDNKEGEDFVSTIDNNGVKFTANYNLDLSIFFKNNNKYDKTTSIASSVMSCIIYDNTDFEPDSEGYKLNCQEKMNEGFSILNFLKYHGFTDLRLYSIENGPFEKDQHITDVAFGHRLVEYYGKEKEIVAVIVRGTNNTLEEWSSNFDIGSSEIYESRKHSDWVVKDNHMGFDITATRVIDYIDYYINKDATLWSDDIALWITGHSRGGAISNIIGARVIDELKAKSGEYLNGSRIKDFDNIYVYTFAAPNTTTKDPDLLKTYNYIFNIINSDDLIPSLPLLKWGFRRYGRDFSESVKEKYRNEWKNIANRDYISNPDGKDDLLEAFYRLACDRDDCYNYKCECHGDGSDIGTSFFYSGTDWSNLCRSTEIKYGLSYTKTTTISMSGNDTTLKACDTTAFLMQYLAALAAASGKTKIPFLEYTWEEAPIYFFVRLSNTHRNVRDKFIDFSTYLPNPHYPVSYYLLATKISY